MSMRRLLGSVVPAVLLLALPAGALSACGDESGSVADDPAPTASQDPSGSTKGPSGEEVDFEVVAVLTETAAGGTTSPAGVPLGDQDAVLAFTEQFETDALPTRIQDAVAGTEVPDDMLLYGAVVAIGCDTPTDLTVIDSGSGILIGAQQVADPMPECFAPMTTVALVLVPASAV
jgi:hypothetical protein